MCQDDRIVAYTHHHLYRHWCLISGLGNFHVLRIIDSKSTSTSKPVVWDGQWSDEYHDSSFILLSLPSYSTVWFTDQVFVYQRKVRFVLIFYRWVGIRLFGRTICGVLFEFYFNCELEKENERNCIKKRLMTGFFLPVVMIKLIVLCKLESIYCKRLQKII